MQVNFNQIEDIRKRHPGQKLVFCAGGFDLTHGGHVIFFEDCKKLGDILVVGIASDATRRQERGPARPVLNEHLRIRTVDALKPVDYSFIISRLAESHEDKMTPIDSILERLQPDVWVVNEDAYDIPRREQLAKKMGFELVVLKRWCPPEFENISTTAIIEKIKRLPD